MLIVSLTKSGPNDLYSVTRIVFSFSVNFRKIIYASIHMWKCSNYQPSKCSVLALAILSVSIKPYSLKQRTDLPCMWK